LNKNFMSGTVKGFSKLSKEAKIEWLANQHFKNPEKAIELLKSYWHEDAKVQKLHDDFIENTISNYYLPFGIAPNFLINGKMYTLPMAIEESSVVAAASKAASFWKSRGGFKTTVISTLKIGHVHFIYNGNADWLRGMVESNQSKFLEDCSDITANMRNRGGGIIELELIDRSDAEPGYFQIQVKFETCDSMGANFINSCLEQIAKTLRGLISSEAPLAGENQEVQIVMCILSNYTPECIVRAEVSCPIEELEDGSGVSPSEFVEKFQRAVRIAQIERYRATTHNKGIFNGIDAVVIATGNDFRAVEAAGHTYASRNGRYQSLTDCAVKEGRFYFWIELPLALGTVGGLTSLHPLVKLAHEMLGNPNAEELMMIVAASGLAQNFGALRALVTTGIQKGHMKMHLFNILNQLEATDQERETMVRFFSDKVVAHNEVVRKFCELRGISYESFVGRNR
jgi:hydroxymethylglutaryl-CoA reductase